LSRPSEPLLRWLRQQIDARGENTASLATRIGRPRGELRKVLTGVEPLTVDDLVRMTEALGVTSADVNLPVVADVEGDDAVESPHWENQPWTLFRLGFDHGIDFLFLAAADDLEDWGGPEAVREAHKGRELAIQLDSQFHRYMNPRMDDAGVSLTLSFDTLYDCRFPWKAIRRVVFTPLPPAPPKPVEPPKPGLRLVK